MKDWPSLLVADLSNGSTTFARLFKIKRRDGVIMPFTDCDTDLIVDDLSGDGALTYKAATGFNRGAIQNRSDLSVGNMQVIGVLDNAALNESDLRAGVYDFAAVWMYLVNHEAVGHGVGILKRGFLGQVSLIDNGFTAEFLSLTNAFAQQIIDIYTRDCSADVFDARCKVSPTSYTDSAVVASVSNARHSFVATITPLTSRASGFYDQGSAVWLTGNNAGKTCEIKTCDVASGATILFLPTSYAIQIGDTLNMRAGCDKLLSTCIDKFDDVDNFRGPAVFCPDLDQVTKTPSLI